MLVEKATQTISALCPAQAYPAPNFRYENYIACHRLVNWKQLTVQKWKCIWEEESYPGSQIKSCKMNLRFKSFVCFILLLEDAGCRERKSVSDIIIIIKMLPSQHKLTTWCGCINVFTNMKISCICMPSLHNYLFNASKLFSWQQQNMQKMCRHLQLVQKKMCYTCNSNTLTKIQNIISW